METCELKDLCVEFSKFKIFGTAHISLDTYHDMHLFNFISHLFLETLKPWDTIILHTDTGIFNHIVKNKEGSDIQNSG